MANPASVKSGPLVPALCQQAALLLLDIALGLSVRRDTDTSLNSSTQWLCTGLPPIQALQPCKCVCLDKRCVCECVRAWIVYSFWSIVI